MVHFPMGNTCDCLAIEFHRHILMLLKMFPDITPDLFPSLRLLSLFRTPAIGFSFSAFLDHFHSFIIYTGAPPKAFQSPARFKYPQIAL